MSIAAIALSVSSAPVQARIKNGRQHIQPFVHIGHYASAVAISGSRLVSRQNSSSMGVGDHEPTLCRASGSSGNLHALPQQAEMPGLQRIAKEDKAAPFDLVE